MSNKQSYLTIQIPIALAAAAAVQNCIGFLTSQAEEDDDADSVNPTTVAAAQAGTTPAAPTNAAAPSGAPAGNVELDVNNSPWDERIHASTKNKNKDGTWKKRKGVDEAVFKKVSAEITSGAAATVGATPLPGPSAPGLPTGGPSLPGPVAETAYQKFVKLVAEHSNSPANPSGRITGDYLKQVIEYVGIADGTMQSLAHNEPATIAADKFIREQLQLAPQ